MPVDGNRVTAVEDTDATSVDKVLSAVLSIDINGDVNNTTEGLRSKGVDSRRAIIKYTMVFFDLALGLRTCQISITIGHPQTDSSKIALFPPNLIL